MKPREYIITTPTYRIGANTYTNKFRTFGLSFFQRLRFRIADCKVSKPL